MTAQQWFDLTKKVIQAFSGAGFDIIICVCIAILTHVGKLPFKKIKQKYKWVPIAICFLMGLIVGLSQIIILKIPAVNWIRVIFGYPAFTSLSYWLIKKRLDKKNERDCKK